MPLSRLSREAVLEAVEEFDRLGRDAFLDKYGYGRAISYELRVNGRSYDPKAIAGVAYGFDHPDQGPLRHDQFSGGKELQRAYRDTGFTVAQREAPAVGSIQVALTDFMRSYPEARRGEFSGTPARRQLESAAEALRSQDSVGSRSLSVSASIGQGNWAEIPWIALLDPRETDSTQRGIYPVFLFRSDMGGVYLTLAQGITAPSAQGRIEMRRHLRATAEQVRPLINNRLRERDFTANSDVHLGTGSKAQGYRESVIVHKFYPVDSVPTDDDILEDLDALLELADAAIVRRREDTSVAQVNIAEIVRAFREMVDSSGLRIPQRPHDRVRAFLAAIATKPFVILTGMSGSGKTQLAMCLGEWCGKGPNGDRSLVVPVRPDWTGPEALFGYEDALRPSVAAEAAWYVPKTLEFLLAAGQEPDMPYVLILDEMNLAHVERYFSDFLSGVESRKRVLPNLQRGADNEWRRAQNASTEVPLPRNLIVIGTVNVDETTYQFSPKVLDRATTFEMRTRTDELSDQIARPTSTPPAEPSLLKGLSILMADDEWPKLTTLGESVADHLRTLHIGLSKTDDEFGLRLFYESLRFAGALELCGVASSHELLDHLVLLKILPRIHGSRRRVEPVLQRIGAFAVDPDGPDQLESLAVDVPALPMTMAKVRRMLRSAEINQFVSFTD